MGLPFEDIGFHVLLLALGDVRGVAHDNIVTAVFSTSLQHINPTEKDLCLIPVGISASYPQGSLRDVPSLDLSPFEKLRKTDGNASASRPDIKNAAGSIRFPIGLYPTNQFLRFRTRDKHIFIHLESPSTEDFRTYHILYRLVFLQSRYHFIQNVKAFSRNLFIFAAVEFESRKAESFHQQHLCQRQSFGVGIMFPQGISYFVYNGMHDFSSFSMQK